LGGKFNVRFGVSGYSGTGGPPPRWLTCHLACPGEGQVIGESHPVPGLPSTYRLSTLNFNPTPCAPNPKPLLVLEFHAWTCLEWRIDGRFGAWGGRKLALDKDFCGVKCVWCSTSLHLIWWVFWPNFWAKFLSHIMC